MRIPMPFGRKKSPPNPLVRQLVWYWRCMALAVIAPVAVGVPYLQEAIPTCIMLSVVIIAWHVARVLSRRRRSGATGKLLGGAGGMVLGGLAAVFGTLFIAIFVSAIYVLRHGQAVPESTGLLMEITGVVYLGLSHFLVSRFVHKRWPIPDEPFETTLPA